MNYRHLNDCTYTSLRNWYQLITYKACSKVLNAFLLTMLSNG